MGEAHDTIGKITDFDGFCFSLGEEKKALP